MNTITKTQSVSATKLAVATAVLLAAGGLALATAPAMKQSSTAPVLGGANLVKVSSCEQKGADIEISKNNGPKYILKAGCKNAGYGFRNYAFECVKGGGATSTVSTVYKVSWTPCATLSVAADTDTLAATGGVITVGVNKLLAVFNFNAFAKDATIYSLILTKTGTLQNKNLANIKLTDASGSVLANGQLGAAGPDKIGFSFNQVIPSSTGLPTKLMLTADVLDATPGGDTLSFSINSAADIGLGSDIFTAPKIEVTIFPVTYGPLLVNTAAMESAGTLNIAIANDSPNGVAVPGMGKVVAKFVFSALDKDIVVKGLSLMASSSFPVTDWGLYLDKAPLSSEEAPVSTGSMQVASNGPFKINFSNFEAMVAAGTSKTFIFTADTAQAGTGSYLAIVGFTSGSDINAYGAFSNQFPVPAWPKMLMYDNGSGATVPVLFVSWAMDTPSGVSAPSMGQIVGKLKFANSGDVGQEAAKINSLTINGGSTFSVSGWKLYKDSISNPSLAEGQAVASETGTFKVVFSNFETMIAGGQDKTFFITADTTAVTKLPPSPLTPKQLSIQVKSASDIGSSVAVKDNFPLSWKTFTY